ncbi:TIGR02391 family protein [Conexibacter sp. JD483]|uniref:TIGR02391 family protein n=1 Tax=unclassified Conexibacter TaxID=2627773 RepID=UPI00271A65C5|nr:MULTISPECIES: TIGR02391 family protein [unclassified Conexibacter]MDO8184654.1 TIGR02391 family protein [Conexibacter sp. CPCC 205706]MDO8197960.1 TIGR02391 family protein [Conexibacter sp. CPCC 205762]MDR9368390.1 TIGR02391 family protein [Conexibacter sp. JD483]
MLKLTQELLDVPIDQLGLMVLKDFLDNDGWNRSSYVGEARGAGASIQIQRALAEAFSWLEGRGLLALDPSQSSSNAVFVTRIGRLVAEDGPDAFYATERLQRNLHRAIERVARPQFLIGAYEQGVFVAMKAVEVRVRALCRLGDEVVGVDLMNKAWGRSGLITDPDAVPGEQEGTRALFAGAYAVFRNPSGHREVDYDDVVEAAEMVQLASLLMRILDRTERRISSK